MAQRGIRLALVVLVLCLAPRAAAPAAVPQETPKDVPKDAPKQTPPAAEPAEQTQEDGQDAPARKSADEVLEEILRKRPQARLVPPVGQPEGADNDVAAWPEGWQIVSRAGRLVPDGDDWLFVFESDSPENPEPRLRLLPNLKLEAMVRETRAAGSSPLYVVSGEVTVFFGENYLLTRLALRKPASSNLSK